MFTDVYAQDLSWELIDLNNNTVIGEGDNFTSSSAYDYTICAIQGTPLQFTINDLQQKIKN